jgi:hypothetical protein
MEGTRFYPRIEPSGRGGLISWNDAKVFCDWLTNLLSPAD